jgi:hypothetical protein
VGGKKTYTNNVPTLNMPMQTKPKKTVRRTTKNSSGERARILSPKRLNFEQEVEIENEVPEEESELINLRIENQQLKDLLESIKHEHNIKINELNKTIEDRTFSIETFKDNPKLFMFYTGFQNYELFKVFFEFLGPAVHMQARLLGI